MTEAILQRLPAQKKPCDPRIIQSFPKTQGPGPTNRMSTGQGALLMSKKTDTYFREQFLLSKYSGRVETEQGCGAAEAVDSLQSPVDADAIFPLCFIKLTLTV